MTKDNRLKILQVGSSNWSENQEIPENMKWYYCNLGQLETLQETIEEDEIKAFTAVIVDSLEGLEELMVIKEYLIPHTIFFDQTIEVPDESLLQFLKEVCAVPTDFSNQGQLLFTLSKALFSGQYGDKMSPFTTQVNPNFTGDVTYHGHENVILKGDYGQDFSPVLDWTYNVRASKENPIELWLEFEKEETCECRLILNLLPEGSVAGIFKTYIVSEEEMRKGAIVLDEDMTFLLAASLEMKGKGQITIGGLHQRLTRFQFGKFVLGGGILHDSKRQEINYFFYPGDFKPPLSVYFSGFRPAEGFEGFGMMKAMGTPFLLFSDPRLQGGAFYIGTEELENSIKDTIQHYLAYLGFDNSQLILSGMSMGTFPSMYYGADFEPHAIIMSKPLANVGTIGNRARLLAPEVFPTGIDVLHLQTGRLDNEGVEALNQKFWVKFEKADFSNTTFGLSYMKDEDMDPTAYEDITKSLYYSGAKILSKGTSGRHNDDSYTATTWFVNFYRMILENDFGRKE